MTLQPGTRLGPYEIVAPIGAGGMGEVFKALDTRLERSVAIKVLPPEFAMNPSLKLRFEREAKSISQLNHPHICTLHDVGSANGVEYLVMELLEGDTLADRLVRGPLPLPEVLKYGAQIADALARAHRAGITHRDLKPGNVMITKSGAKLLDFGLAKSASPVGGADALTEQQKPLTAEGTILGTFQYMAPEQLEGLEADTRTDIFALGAVLYEMATGRRAFEGKTRTSLIAAIVAGEPRPLRELQPLTPPQLEHVIARCLEKDPDKRWQSSQDIAEELKWIASREVEALPLRRRSVWSVAIAGLFLLAGLAGGALLAARLNRSEPKGLIEASIIPPKGVAIEVPSGNGEAVVISPDGQTIAFTGKDASGKRRLWMRELRSREARPIAGTEDAQYPFWSPDSRWIAFFSSRKLRKVALDGSPPLSICDVASNPLSGDWNGDGVILFSPASGAPLHQVSASGGKSAEVTKLDATSGETTHRWARFLPDQKGFLYLAGSHDAAANSEVNAVYAARLGSADRKLIVRTRFNVEYADGHLLFVRGDSLFAQAFNPSRLELEGEARPVVSQIHTSSGSFLAGYSAADREALVYVAGSASRKTEFVWLDPTGKELSKVMQPREIAGSWSVSPDGKTVALTLEDPSAGFDIWLHDLARGALTRLTLGGSGGEAVWSPDGKRIVFSGPDRRFYLKSVDADTPPEVLWTRGVWAGPVSFSPDGHHLAFWTFDPKAANEYDVWVLPLDGERKPIPIANTTATEFPITFSPDGRWFLYSSNASGQTELYAVSFPDLQRKKQISVGGAAGAIWKGAREIWYRQPDSTWASVQIEERDGRLQTSPPRPLFRDERITDIAVPAGQERILASRLVGEVEAPETVLVSNWGALLKSGRH